MIAHNRHPARYHLLQHRHVDILWSGKIGLVVGSGRLLLVEQREQAAAELVAACASEQLVRERDRLADLRNERDLRLARRGLP